MGTRAQFFIGNPENPESRQWLGCVAWDGYPEGEIGKALDGKCTDEEFRAAVGEISKLRGDFCDPETQSFPFPWNDDLFLTDFTYALFDGVVQATSFHTGWAPLSEHLKADDDWLERYNERGNEISCSVPAPQSAEKPKGPDSIIVVQAG